MIFNLVHKSLSSLVKTSVNSTFRSFFSPACFLRDANKFNLSCRSFSVSTPMRGLDEFFENGQAYPIYEQDKKVVFGTELMKFPSYFILKGEHGRLLNCVTNPLKTFTSCGLSC
jgi:hypothetical protein